MTKLNEIGEFGLIQRFASQFADWTPPGFTGIGDDCAILPINKVEAWLITTDMLVENSHFIRNKISPYSLGYKSLAVNISDIAAMGGVPSSMYLSIGIPSSISVEWLDEFFRGLYDLSKKTGTYLLGGDTTKTPEHLVINVIVQGIAYISNIKTRDSAVAGDIVCITDPVGDSSAGLEAIMQNLPLTSELEYVIDRHYHPDPHLKEGNWLANKQGVNAMIDISDGIASDIKHIMHMSKVGAEIDIDAIPVSKTLKTVTDKYRWNLLHHILGGGEDYCLLCTIREDVYESVAREYMDEFSKPLYGIGRITDESSNLRFKKGDAYIDPLSEGFNHFKT